MPGCVAVGCSNSDTKGFIMRVFPRDPTRRKQWANIVSREDWSPSNTSYLCEIHFDGNQWEKRLDGKPKLKPNAVPSLFVNNMTENKRGSSKSKKKPAAESTTTNRNDSSTDHYLNSLRSTKILYDDEQNTSTGVFTSKSPPSKLRKRNINPDDDTGVPFKYYKANGLKHMAVHELTLKRGQTVKPEHECENCIILEELLKCASNTVAELKNTLKQYDQSLINLTANFEKISQSRKPKTPIKKPKIEHAYSRSEF